MTWDGLTPPYATIVADPPWEYDDQPAGWQRASGRRTFLPYSTMTLDQIERLPVSDLASPGAHLYLWTTNRYLEAAYSVARAWGFNPSTVLIWCKAPMGLGTGGRFTPTAEFALFAVSRQEQVIPRAGQLIQTAREAAGISRADLYRRVRPGKRLTGLVRLWEVDDCLPNDQDWQRLQAVLPMLADVPRPDIERREVPKVDRTWWQWPRGRHSEKPAAFLDVVEQVSPSPYIELFARQPRLGWDHWGFGYEQSGGAA